MGITNPSVQNRAPPLSLRTQKDMARQSPQSRLRSRSYSHDKELCRTGLRKNAAGEWNETDNLPTAGIAAAMRAMRIKKEESEGQASREGTVDSSVDMADSTAVYEEIRVYMEEAASREGSYMDVDEPGEGYLRSVSVMSMGTVLQTIEIEIEFLDEEFALAMKIDDSADMRSESLGSIKEEREGRDPTVEMERALLSSSTDMEAPRPPLEQADSQLGPSLPSDQSIDIAEVLPVSAADNKRKTPARFQCTLCPKRYTRAYYLRSHLRNTHL